MGMITKENIKELLEKYFDAEATLEEEVLIRGYFTEGEIDAEFEAYAALFRSLSKEREEYLSVCVVDDISSKVYEDIDESYGIGERKRSVSRAKSSRFGRRTGLRRRYYIVSIASAAAVFVLGLFAVIKNRGNPVLIINGEKIYNTELAIAMAGESFDSMNMAIEKIQSNRIYLEKIGKMGEIMSSLEEMSRGLSQNGEEDRLNSELKD